MVLGHTHKQACPFCRTGGNPMAPQFPGMQQPVIVEGILKSFKVQNVDTGYTVASLKVAPHSLQ